MAVLFKFLVSGLFLAVLTQGTFGAPKGATETRVTPGTSRRDPEGFSEVKSVPDPKKGVDLADPVPSNTPLAPTTASTPIQPIVCPGADDGPSNTTVILLQTRVDQLASEFRTPRSAVVEALGEEVVRRLQSGFAIASLGFQGMIPIANELVSEADLPCAVRTTMLKLYTETNARLTKKVANTYGVLASKVREAMAKNDKDSNSTLQLAADEYDSLRTTYHEAYERAERLRVAVAKLTIDGDGASQTTGGLSTNELARPISESRQAK